MINLYMRTFVDLMSL